MSPVTRCSDRNRKVLTQSHDLILKAQVRNPAGLRPAIRLLQISHAIRPRAPSIGFPLLTIRPPHELGFDLDDHLV